MTETPLSTFLWQITLLGGLRAEGNGQSITRFRTRRAAQLLAYVAHYGNRDHAREELIARFWPDADMDSGRMSLRTALASLRRQLEPPGVPAGAVLQADRTVVRLNTSVVQVDTRRFDTLLRQARRSAAGSAERLALLAQAVTVYGGDLLPGHYDDWVLGERERLTENYRSALGEIGEIAGRDDTGDLGQALDATFQAAALDPLDEEARVRLMRLLQAADRPQAALRQYAQLTQVLEEELGSLPEPRTARLAETLRQDAQTCAEAPDRAPTIAAIRPAAIPTAPFAAPRLPRLPLPFTRFFGREEEIETLTRRLGDPATRLVTLTGPGGSGKTRLAIEAARRLEPHFGDAAWFVSLADLTDAQFIAQTVAESVDAERLSTSTDSWLRLGAHVALQPSLLLLDNYERLVEDGALFVLDLLQRFPTVTALVTSRQRLQIEGEQVFEVAPLPVPSEQASDLEQIRHLPAVRLFVDRAQTARPDFQITPRNAARIARLCRGLEGIPLAIELAAAHAPMRTLEDIEAQISQSLDALASRRRDIAPRHRTLRATIAWSVETLPDPLRELFADLAVFHGGWTLESAAAVRGQTISPLLDDLTELRERSLLLASPDGHTMRYRMLETIREYAAEMLLPEHHVSLARRHAVFFAELAEEANPCLYGPDSERYAATLDVEQENLRAALEFCESDSDSGGQTGLRLVAALCRYWYCRGSWNEARDWPVRLLRHPRGQMPTEHRANALAQKAWLTNHEQEPEVADAHYRQAEAIYRKIGNQKQLAFALAGISFLSPRLGRNVFGRQAAEEAWQIADALDDDELRIYALSEFAMHAFRSGDPDAGRARFQQCIRVAEKCRDRENAATAREALAVWEAEYLQFDAGRLLLQDALRQREEREQKWAMARVRRALGFVALHHGLLEDAEQHYQAAERLSGETGEVDTRAEAQQGRARILIERARFTEARALLDLCVSGFQHMDRPSFEAGAWEDGARLAAIAETGEPAGEQLRRAYTLRCRMPGEVARIPWLETVAFVAARIGGSQDAVAQAAALWGALEAERERQQIVLSPLQRRALTPAWEQAQKQAGAAAFDAAWKRGRRWRLDESVQQALTLVEALKK